MSFRLRVHVQSTKTHSNLLALSFFTVPGNYGQRFFKDGFASRAQNKAGSCFCDRLLRTSDAMQSRWVEINFS